MKMTTKIFSVCMLLSISLGGCKAAQVPEENPTDRGATQSTNAAAVHISSEAQFEQLVGQGNVVLDFYAPWCGPCKQLGPVIDEFAQEFPTVTFLKVNVDQMGGLVGRYGVRSMPTVFFLKDGSQLQKIVGYTGNKSGLRATIMQVFSLQ